MFEGGWPYLCCFDQHTQGYAVGRACAAVMQLSEMCTHVTVTGNGMLLAALIMQCMPYADGLALKAL